MTHQSHSRLRLQTRLLLLLFGFGVVPVLLVVGVGYAVSRAAMVSQSEQSLQELARRQARYLVGEIRREQLILRTIAGRVAPAMPRTSREGLEGLLAGSLTEDGVFDGLRLIDSTGGVVADVALLATAPDWPPRRIASPPESGPTIHRDNDAIVAYLLSVPVGPAIAQVWLQGHVRAEDFPRNLDVPLHVLGGGSALHPYLDVLIDKDRVAIGIDYDETRWSRG